MARKLKKKLMKRFLKKIEEKRLFLSTVDLKKDYEKNTELLNKKSFYDLSKNINEFLDNVMVNSPDTKIKNNRISLLKHCKEIVDNFFNFSAL